MIRETENERRLRKLKERMNCMCFVIEDDITQEEEILSIAEKGLIARIRKYMERDYGNINKVAIIRGAVDELEEVWCMQRDMNGMNELIEKLSVKLGDRYVKQSKEIEDEIERRTLNWYVGVLDNRRFKETFKKVLSVMKSWELNEILDIFESVGDLMCNTEYIVLLASVQSLYLGKLRPEIEVRLEYSLAQEFKNVHKWENPEERHDYLVYAARATKRFMGEDTYEEDASGENKE